MILHDGYSTTISFIEFPGIILLEKEVTPPGWDGGGAIDTTTMRNFLLRTRWPKALKTMTEVPIVAAYDPDVLDPNGSAEIVNVLQQIMLTFPDLSTIVFWGWVNDMKPNRHVEGEQPTLNATVIPSNMDTDGNEVLPLFTPGVA